MTFRQHIRLAGAIVYVIAVFLGNILLNVFGFMIMVVGVVIHIDDLEKRVQNLESKENPPNEG